VFIYAGIIFQANVLPFVHIVTCVCEVERAGGRNHRELGRAIGSHHSFITLACPGKKNRPFHLAWPAGKRGRVNERERDTSD